MRTFPQFSYHFCPFYNASVLTERLRFAILRTVQMSGDHRHQRPLTSLEKQDSWLSGLLYHVIFFSDLYMTISLENDVNFDDLSEHIYRVTSETRKQMGVMLAIDYHDSLHELWLEDQDISSMESSSDVDKYIKRRWSEHN